MEDHSHGRKGQNMEPRLKMAAALAIGAVLVCQVGCRTTYRVGYDTYADPTCPRDLRSRKVCVVEPPGPANPILAGRLKARIDFLLRGRGGIVHGQEDAEYVLGYGFGSGPEFPVVESRRRYETGQTITIETYDENGGEVEKTVQLP